MTKYFLQGKTFLERGIASPIASERKFYLAEKTKSESSVFRLFGYIITSVVYKRTLILFIMCDIKLV